MVPLAPGALPRLNDTDSDCSDGDAGEKDAKRQKSEPTTPVSTSSRMPYEYDALMGITRVGSEEAKWFEEDLGTPEYHDAAEEPIRREEVDDKQPEPRSTGFQGGYGSSSLKECIDLLNAKNARPRDTPAPLDSGVDQDPVSPPHFAGGGRWARPPPRGPPPPGKRSRDHLTICKCGFALVVCSLYFV